MRLIFVCNPSAGDNTHPGENTLMSLMQNAGHEVKCFPAKTNAWLEELDESVDCVVVAGGDGTIGRIAKMLAGKKVPMVILPKGTANNISRTFGLTEKSLQEIIASVNTAEPVRVDCPEAIGPWGRMTFVESFGVGLFAEAMKQINSSGALEKLSDTEKKLTGAIEILKDKLGNFNGNKLKVTLDGQDLSGDYLLLEVMNISYVGPNLFLAPDAEPGDGLLDVVLVSKSDRENLLQYLDSQLNGEKRTPSLRRYRGKNLVIEGENLSVHIDDESECISKIGEAVTIHSGSEGVHFLLAHCHSKKAPSCSQGA